MMLRTAVALEDLLGEPAKVGDLLPAAAMGLLRDCEARLTAYQGLRDALLIRAFSANGSSPGRRDEDNRLLDAAEVGQLIGKSRSWVEHNISELPERIRVGGEGRWSEHEIQRWMLNRPRWNEPA